MAGASLATQSSPSMQATCQGSLLLTWGHQFGRRLCHRISLPVENGMRSLAWPFLPENKNRSDLWLGKGDPGWSSGLFMCTQNVADAGTDPKPTHILLQGRMRTHLKASRTIQAGTLTQRSSPLVLAMLWYCVSPPTKNRVKCFYPKEPFCLDTMPRGRPCSIIRIS